MKKVNGRELKIFIVCPFTSPNQGGVESHIQKLIKYLNKKDKDIIIVSYRPLTREIKTPFYEKIENYEIYRQPWFGVGLFPKIEKNLLLTFLYLVPGLLFLTLYVGMKRRSEFNIIHAHGFAAGFCAIFLKLLTGKRLVISTHAIYNLENRSLLAFFLKSILRNVDRVLAVSRPSMDEIIKIGIPKEKVEVHPNWVETGFFSPASKKPKEVKVLLDARALRMKGIFLFGELAIKNPKTNFIARLGEGPGKEEFINKFSNLANLEIRSIVPVDFDKKMRVLRDDYRESSVFMMPSLYPEGFATVILQAASCGLAIISSNLGSLPSILSGSGAILIKPTLANFDLQLRRLVSNRTKLHQMQVMSRKFTLRNFSDKNAEVIYRSYRV